MLSLSILGLGTLVKGEMLANFKSTLVRPLESIAEIQLQLQLPLLSLSAMLSEYFTRVIFSPFFSPRQWQCDIDLARYPVIGRWMSSRAAIAIDYAKFFQLFTSCCLLQKDRLAPRALQKHLTISPIPLPSFAAP